MTRVRARARAAALGAATVLALLVVWEAGVRVSGVAEFILPAPSQIAATAAAQAPLLSVHVTTTATEAVLGLAAGALLGWLLAVVCAVAPPVGDAAQPLVLLSQTIPTVVLAPLLILWAGFGLASKVLLVSLTVFFPVMIATAAAIRDVDSEHAAMVAGLGGTRRHQLALVRMPASIPGALAGLRIAATYAIGAAVVSEYLAGESGIGVYIQRSRKAYEVDQIFVGIVLIAVLTGALVLGIVALRRVLTPWQPAAATL